MPSFLVRNFAHVNCIFTLTSQKEVHMFGDFFTRVVSIHLWVYVLAIFALFLNAFVGIMHFINIRREHKKRGN